MSTWMWLQNRISLSLNIKATMCRTFYYLVLGIVFQFCSCQPTGENTNMQNRTSVSPDYQKKACHFHQGTLECTEADFQKFNLSVVEVLHLTSLKNILELNLSSFTFVHKLIIRHTSITNLTVSLPRLEEMDISSNQNLSRINMDIISNLRTLNLSHNRLKDIDTRILNPSLISVDLTGNEWTCKENYSWAIVLHREGKLKNPLDFKCIFNEGEHDWNRHAYRILHFYEAQKKSSTQCKQRTPKCSCEFYNLQANDSHILYSISVSCCSRNLTELPDQLPDETIELDVSNNSITDLDQVSNYPSLSQLIADNNAITSAMELSNTRFIKQFSLLSLKSNPIPPDQIPFEEFESDVTFGRFISLENNSWICNEQLATEVRPWLWENRRLLEKSGSSMSLKIYCLDQNEQLVDVFFLFPHTEDNTWNGVIILHWLIGIEVSLIVLVFAKLSFDSYEFMRNGQLPWLASKIF